MYLPYAVYNIFHVHTLHTDQKIMLFETTSDILIDMIEMSEYVHGMWIFPNNIIDVFLLKHARGINFTHFPMFFTFCWSLTYWNIQSTKGKAKKDHPMWYKIAGFSQQNMWMHSLPVIVQILTVFFSLW